MEWLLLLCDDVIRSRNPSLKDYLHPIGTKQSRLNFYNDSFCFGQLFWHRIKTVQLFIMDLSIATCLKPLQDPKYQQWDSISCRWQLRMKTCFAFDSSKMSIQTRHFSFGCAYILIEPTWVQFLSPKLECGKIKAGTWTHDLLICCQNQNSCKRFGTEHKIETDISLVIISTVKLKLWLTMMINLTQSLFLIFVLLNKVRFFYFFCCVLRFRPTATVLVGFRNFNAF